MQKSGFFLLFLFMMLWSSIVGASSAFDGKWEGSGEQTSGSKWSIVINIDSSTNSYTITYPSLKCGGILTLLSATDERIEFDEKITYGSSCVDNGKTVLVKSNDNKANFLWYFANGSQDASGVVERGSYLSFAQSGYNVKQEEDISLHPNGSFKTAGVNRWTEEAISTIEYKVGIKIEVSASKQWWSGDRCPTKIEFLDSASNKVGSIDFNPQAYSGNAVNFYKNKELIYAHTKINPNREYSKWEGGKPSMNGNLSGYFEFMQDTLRFTSYKETESFGSDIELDYSFAEIKYIRVVSKSLGTYSTGRALSSTKLLSASTSIDLNKGLVAHYKFEGNAKDSSGNGNHGTAKNGVKFSADTVNQAAVFSDTKEIRIDVPDSNSLDTHDAFSLSMWVNPSKDLGRGNRFIEKYYSSEQWAGGEYALGMTKEGKVFFSIANFDSTKITDIIEGNKIPLNQWSYIVASFDQGHMQLYIDNILVKEKISSIKQITTKEYTHDNIHIGNIVYNTWNDGWFVGKMDELRIYNRALNEGEIKELYKQGASDKFIFNKVMPQKLDLIENEEVYFDFNLEKKTDDFDSIVAKIYLAKDKEEALSNLTNTSYTINYRQFTDNTFDNDDNIFVHNKFFKFTAPSGLGIYYAGVCIQYLYKNNLETAIKQCSEPVKIEVKEVPTKSKVIKGIVKTDQGVAVSGITVKFEYLVDGKEDSVSVVSDASGNYDIKIDKSVFNEVSETTYLIYAYKESYHPSTKTLKVGATDNYTVNFTINLIKTNEVVLEIEPKVHHLGDDNYNGSNNSQFQKKTEGVSFSKSFDISAAQYQNYAEASLSFQSKGIETGGNLSINGHDYNLSPSSSNGSYKTYTLAVEKSFYTEGSNNLKVTSDVSKGDYDDFEFSNIVLTLSGTGIIDTDKDGMPDDWEKQHSLDPNDSGDAIKDFDGDGISNLDEYKQGTDPKVANANIDVTVSVPVLTGEFQENSEYSVSVEVSNAGSATITFGNVDIYLSTDQSHSNDDKKLATFEFKQLASKTTQTLANLKMTLPIAGNYWFYAHAKPLTGETNQDNNYSALRKITVRSKTANYQMVSIKSCTPATPDSVVSCTVQYNTSDGDKTLSGFSFNLHYPTALTLSSIDSVFDNDLVNFNKIPLEDTEDNDKNSLTDRYLGFAWANASGEWPNQVLATELLTLSFKVNKDLKIGGFISLDFSSSDTANGYGFATRSHFLKVGTGCNLDIDNNGETKALTDGLLTLRYLFGFRGDTLISNAVSDKAKRKTASDIESYLQKCNPAFDIDNNGETKALTDGLLVLRYLFNFNGDTLISNAVAETAKRKTTKEIEDYLGVLK